MNEPKYFFVKEQTENQLIKLKKCDTDNLENSINMLINGFILSISPNKQKVYLFQVYLGIFTYKITLGWAAK